MKKGEGKRFFFEKKNQKTFGSLSLGGETAWGPKKSKVFCFFFFKKEVLSSCFRLRRGLLHRCL
jgi:hypothetical protein